MRQTQPLGYCGQFNVKNSPVSSKSGAIIRLLNKVVRKPKPGFVLNPLLTTSGQNLYLSLVEETMRKAFTLIELLVVIAIIAILAAILFPVFAQAKLAAKKTVVLSNSKQIGLSQFMYANDYDDMSPALGQGDWTDHLYPYVKN